MKNELEICVRAKENMEDIEAKLKENKFELKEDFIMNDIYLIHESLKNKEMLKQLSDYILIRETVGKRKQIVRKFKEYDKEGNIIFQNSQKCEIKDINQALELFKALGYIELVDISDHIKLWANEVNEIYVQKICDAIFFEIESKTIHIDSNNGNNPEELSKVLNKYDFKYDNSDLFVKKVEEKIKGKI